MKDHGILGPLSWALIPWALGIGAVAWLSFAVGAHQFRAEQRQEARAAVYVGAEELPSAKMEVVIRRVDDSLITRVDLQGKALALWATANAPDGGDSYFAWHWRLLSPDGTILKEGFTNYLCPRPTLGHPAECRLSIDEDARAKRIEVWTSRSPG